MLNKSMMFVVVLTLSSFALAQHKTQQQVMAEGASHSPLATTTCDVTYTSGTGENASQFCVTVNGNIPQFSVAGQEMIEVGTVAEGYGICDTLSGLSYYDYAYEDSGNWNSPTTTVSGNTVTITRLTSDGIWKLKQTIVNTPASSTSPASAKVTMALKNVSGVTRFAYLLRYADVDANSTFTNDFDYTSQTSYGLDPGFNRGLGLTNGTFNSSVGQLAFVQDVFDGPDPCNPFGNLPSAQPFVGDGSIGQFWDEDLGHNQTLTAVATYKGI